MNQRLDIPAVRARQREAFAALRTLPMTTIGRDAIAGAVIDLGRALDEIEYLEAQEDAEVAAYFEAQKYL